MADKTWDNTGLLLDSSSDNIKSDQLNILLTIDLTQSVAEEAVKKSANFIVAYHPFIFRGLKSITTKDPQQRSLIKLIQNNISVYSPHTAVDSAYGGVNDYLVDGITYGFDIQSREAIEKDENAQDCGMGRIVTLKKPAPLSKLIGNVKCSLGLKYVQIARGSGTSKDHEVSTIAICAGAGGSVFKGIKADLYFTGELSHHEALYFTESGSSIITTNHSNTERAFLKVIKKQLSETLQDANVFVSETDRDPYELA